MSTICVVTSRFGRRAMRVLAAFALCSCAVLSLSGTAQAVFDPDECTPGLDTLGLIIASGGDFNGDGIDDFAYSAPCARMGKFDHAGRMWIRSGDNGKVLRRARGN